MTDKDVANHLPDDTLDEVALKMTTLAWVDMREKFGEITEDNEADVRNFLKNRIMHHAVELRKKHEKEKK